MEPVYMIQVEEQQESSLSLNHNFSHDSSMHTSISVPTTVVEVSDSINTPAIISNDSISSPQRMSVVTTNNRRNYITKVTNSPVSVVTIESRVAPSSSSSSIPIPSIPIPPLNVDFCTGSSSTMKPIQLDFSIYCATTAPLSTPPIKGILKSKSNYSPSLSATKTTTVRNSQTSSTSRDYYQGKTERRVKGLWNPTNHREDIILENRSNKIDTTKTKKTTYYNQQQNKNSTTKTNPFDLLHNEFLVKDILGSFATLYEKTKIIPLVCKRFQYLANTKEFSEYYFHTIDNHEHHTITFRHSDHLSHNKKNDCDIVLLLKNIMKKHNPYIKTISLNANSLTLSPSHTTSKSDHLLNNLLLTHDNSSIYQHIFPSSSLQNLNLIHFDTLTDTHLQCLFLFHKMQVNRNNENKNKFTTLLSPSMQQANKNINRHFFSFDESNESLLFMKNETPKLIHPSTRQRSHTITEELSFPSSLFSRSTSLPRQNSSLNNNMSTISTLKTLKLEYCPLLTNQSLYYIKLHCSQLQYLSLKGNTQINIQGLYHLQSLFSIVGTTANNSKSTTQRPASMMTLSNLFESYPGNQQDTKKKHVSIISSNSFFTPPSKSSLSSTITSTNIDTSSKSIVTTGGSLTSMDFSFCPGITLRDMNEVLQDSIDNNMKEPCCAKDTNQNASFLDYNFYSQQNSSPERSNKLNASSSSSSFSLSSSHKIILRDLYLSMPTSPEKNNIVKYSNSIEKDNIDIQRFLALTENENQTRSILHFI